MSKVWLRATVVGSKGVELLNIKCCSAWSRFSALTAWDALCGWLAGFRSKCPLAVAMALGIYFANNFDVSLVYWFIPLMKPLRAVLMKVVGAGNPRDA
jgi:hypothetical protein